jgi:hypothetical protein
MFFGKQVLDSERDQKPIALPLASSYPEQE